MKRTRIIYLLTFHHATSSLLTNRTDEIHGNLFCQPHGSQGALTINHRQHGN